ncbi:MAG: hypothetical protein JKX70_07345 [Phycisphaerales bacterium]|nr:hypothetical protein [Phycisphaerales bacterium]
MKSIVPIICIAAATGFASASIISVNFSGTLEDIFDPTGILGGGETWYASIEFDTDMLFTGSRFETAVYQGGSGEFQFGNGQVEFFNGSLRVTDGDPNAVDEFGDPAHEFDVLAIFARPSAGPAFTFYALDFSANTFDSTDFPSLGLTFDTFSQGIVGNTYELNNGFLLSADVVVDTITVTPSPSGLSLLAIASLGVGRRRRRN